MNKSTLGLIATILLLASCETTQIQLTLSDAKAATAQFLHENGVAVKNDPALSFDTSPYRTNTPDKQLSAISPVLSSRVFSAPENLPDLVKALISGVDDPVRQAKILHDWVALNISYDAVSFSKGEIPDQEYTSVLRSKKAVCEGYSNLYLKMCSLAKIKCQKISGYARGVGFNPLIAEDPYKSNHAWNAVLLNGNWYLVDTTWDSGYVNGCGTYSYVRRYSTAYFLLDPQSMLYTHFPSMSMWQLLDPPVKRTEFTNLPRLRGDFFDAVTLIDSSLTSNNIVEATTTLRLGLRSGKQISAHLLNERGKSTDGTVFITNIGDVAELRLIFPKEGKYTLDLFAGNARSTSFQSIGEIIYTATRGSEERFPEQPLCSIGSNYSIISPTSGYVKKGLETVFAFIIPTVRTASLLVGRDFRTMSKNPDGSFSLAVTPLIKGDTISLLIPTNSAATSFETVLVYTVTD